MPQRVSENVKLAPGGFIPDIPENRELLERMAATRKLSPEQLLELAIFFQAYPTNAFLAGHLALVAETTKICEFGGNDPYWDGVEDLVCGYDQDDDDQEEAKAAAATRAFRVYSGDAYTGEGDSNVEVVRARYEIRCIPSLVPGLNLLIETSQGGNPHVIGVCPEREL